MITIKLILAKIAVIALIAMGSMSLSGCLFKWALDWSKGER